MKSTKQVSLRNFITEKKQEAKEFNLEKGIRKRVENNNVIVKIQEALPLTENPFQVEISFSIINNTTEVLISGNASTITNGKLHQESKEKVKSENFSFSDEHFKGISEISSVYNFSTS